MDHYSSLSGEDDRRQFLRFKRLFPYELSPIGLHVGRAIAKDPFEGSLTVGVRTLTLSARASELRMADPKSLRRTR